MHVRTRVAPPLHTRADVIVGERGTTVTLRVKTTGQGHGQGSGVNM